MAGQVRRQPPPIPPPPTNDPALRRWYEQLNRWFLDFSAIISPSGGVDPGQIGGPIIINGNGPPGPGLGNDGDLYFNDMGLNAVIRAGLLNEGTAVKDVTGSQLYGKVSGAWVELV